MRDDPWHTMDDEDQFASAPPESAWLRSGRAAPPDPRRRAVAVPWPELAAAFEPDDPNED